MKRKYYSHFCERCQGFIKVNVNANKIRSLGAHQKFCNAFKCEQVPEVQTNADNTNQLELGDVTEIDNNRVVDDNQILCERQLAIDNQIEDNNHNPVDDSHTKYNDNNAGIADSDDKLY